MVEAKERKGKNQLYLYDLPKSVATSTNIAAYLQQKTGIVLDQMPVMKRDLNKPFYQAVLTIPDDDQFTLACQEMRYFELQDGKFSRGLPYLE